MAALAPHSLHRKTASTHLATQHHRRAGCSAQDDDEFESPTSLDATEPRLEAEACFDDMAILPVAAFGVPA